MTPASHLPDPAEHHEATDLPGCTPEARQHLKALRDAWQEARAASPTLAERLWHDSRMLSACGDLVRALTLDSAEADALLLHLLPAGATAAERQLHAAYWALLLAPSEWTHATLARCPLDADLGQLARVVRRLEEGSRLPRWGPGSGSGSGTLSRA